MKVLVLTADANTLVYHRGDLLRDLAARGCEVVTAAAEDYPHVQEFVRSLGGRHRAIRMARSTVSLARDRETLADMWRLFREEKPDALFAYTIKSVCYGCVLARRAGVPRVHALLPGLGFTFVRQETPRGRLVSWISRTLHRVALRHVDTVFLQNRDDEALLRANHMIPRGTPVHVTAGSGVNLDEFAHAPIGADRDLSEGRVRFVLVSRLLHSKGVGLFAEAARRVKRNHPRAEFHLVGPFDPGPDRVAPEDVRAWVEEGLVTHHGMVRDVASLLRRMHVFVLPTWYREGVPHASLEALAVGRAMITSDSVGSRETVRLTPAGAAQRRQGAALLDGANGFLVRPRDPAAVAEAMERMLQRPDTIPALGLESRLLAEHVFDVRKVNQTILRAMGLVETPAARLSRALTAATA